MAFDFRYQIVIEQPKPPSLSFEEVKELLGRVTAIYFAEDAMKSHITVEYRSKAEADEQVNILTTIVNPGTVAVSQIPCYYCKARPTIKESHVVPKFVINYIRKNCIGDLHYNWEHSPFAHRMIAPPYFCQVCENNTFGHDWEGPFSQQVFPDPLAAGAVWGQDPNLSFTVLMCYRYALHSLAVDPLEAHQPIGIKFRDLAYKALRDLNEVGTSLFVYPYAYQPITESCVLKPHVNNFLSLGFGDIFLLATSGLPDAYLVALPKMLLLFSEADLTATGKPGYIDLIGLTRNKVLDMKTVNVHLPELLHDKINKSVLKTLQDQTNRNEWEAYADPEERKKLPDAISWVAHDYDQALKDWQTANCPKK